MPDKEYSPAEVAANLTLVEHIPAWLKFRGLTQEQLANSLGTSTGSVSKWLRGLQAVSGLQLYAIAQLLKVEHPRLLLSPPDDPHALDGYEPAAEIINALTPEDRQRWIQFGKSLAASADKP